MVLAASAAFPPGLSAAVASEAVQFQDGSGNEKLTFLPGETAEFYLLDQALATTATSSATWTAPGFDVMSGTWWSLATGDPAPSVYELAASSLYDRDNPALTPLVSPPTITVNGVPQFIGDFSSAAGQFKSLFQVNAGSTLKAVFEFDLVDSYSASANRVRVTSTSDVAGEWVSVGEVAGETDSSPVAASGVYRGSVTLSAEPSALSQGDGAVWAPQGDVLAVTYYGPTGSDVTGAHHAQVVGPPPVPGLGVHAHLALTALFALLIVGGWRLSLLRGNGWRLRLLRSDDWRLRILQGIVLWFRPVRRPGFRLPAG